jgi:hypothetical protein
MRRERWKITHIYFIMALVSQTHAYFFRQYSSILQYCHRGSVARIYHHVSYKSWAIAQILRPLKILPSLKMAADIKLSDMFWMKVSMRSYWKHEFYNKYYRNAVLTWQVWCNLCLIIESNIVAMVFYQQLSCCPCISFIICHRIWTLRSKDGITIWKHIFKSIVKRARKYYLGSVMESFNPKCFYMFLLLT